MSPDADDNIEFLTCAAIVSDADWYTTVTIDGCVNIIKDKILSVEDVRKSDVNGADITIHDNVVLASINCVIAGEVDADYVSVDTSRHEEHL